MQPHERVQPSTNDSRGTSAAEAAPDSYRALFERSADAILIIEGDTFIDCNQATVDMLRYASKDELFRRHPSELSPQFQRDGRDSFEKANEMIKTAFRNGSHRFEWDHVRADGEVFPVEVLLTAVPHGAEPILHVVWRDITERKHLEAQLRQALKMEAVGKLAGGIAHDFNNLLVAIMGNAELLEEGLVGEKQAELLGEIREAAGRASELTMQLLAYSRLQILQPRVLDLNEIVTNMNGLLSRLIGKHIEMRTRLADKALPVKVDPGQIEQVLVNLITNARDAMPKGGAVTIETSVVELDEASIGIRGELRAGCYARLTVSDTGIGMSASVRRLAFDPFFTTKRVGEGTGLGLSTVYGIVKQSHGEVTLTSEPLVGTAASVLLPVSDGEPQDLRPPLDMGPEPKGGSETILVAEDEPTVAHLIAKVLRSRGYHVLNAASGADSLVTYLSHTGKIDLLVSDVIMPEMSGPDMVEALRAAGHTPPVLFVSGYTRHALERMTALDADLELLQKPFTVHALLHRVRDLLDRAKTS